MSFVRSVRVRSLLAFTFFLFCFSSLRAQVLTGDVVVTQNTSVPTGNYSPTSLTVTGGATLTIGGGSTVKVSGAVMVIGQSSIVLQSINNTAQVNGVWTGAGSTITAGSVQVDAGSSINADGQGYVASAGPGAGTDNTENGGSYGGAGGNQDPSTIYGSAYAPMDLGSGGGHYQGTAGAGGGAIRLIVTGTLANIGTISANGAAVVSGNTFSGGGSGGSIYVTAASLTGNGIFAANGGLNPTSYGSGGGGGRVAIYYAGPSTFTGFTTSTAAGGSITNPGNGGAPGLTGTAAFFDTSSANSKLAVYQNFTIPANTSTTYDQVAVQNGALLTVGGGSTLTTSGAILVTGQSSIVVQSVNNTAQVNGAWAGAGSTITAGSLQVDSGSSINADGQGYVASAGPGAGTANSDNGGSYGGLGGNQDPSTIYGSATAPSDLGSGGGHYQGTPGAGGGAIRLIVSGALANNGVISANGAPVVTSNTFSGGGSGGTLYVTTGSLTGSGVFTANGGLNPTSYGSGGGGGRVAVYYTGPSTFTGFTTSTASGGTITGSSNGGAPGANGTAAFFDTSASNGNVSVYQNFALPNNSTVQYNSMTIANGATLSVGGGSQLVVTQALHITGTLTAQSINNTAQVNGSWQGRGIKILAGSVQIDSSGAILADGLGYPAVVGPGAGLPGSSNGGSYGGLGGGQPASTLYGSAAQPVDLGSGGGRYQGTPGAGGGAIQLLASGTLTNNGVISANGAAVVSSNTFSGGGSGGSIYLAANTLSGSGTISANGGLNPTGFGNGGGGGRVAVYYVTNSNLNPASVTATGGSSGATAGADGTVTFKSAPVSEWILPAQSVIHGNAVPLSWFTDSGSQTTVVLAGPQTATIAQGSGAFSSTTLDTTSLPDGSYELRLLVLDSTGKTVAEVPKPEVINNSVIWFSGTLTANTHWTANNVYAIDGTLTIPAGITLTIDPGTVVKALPYAQIVVQSGGTLTALGGTNSPVIFTTFDDSSMGGNTDFNQGISLPTGGEWGGVFVNGGGTFNSNSNTLFRYVQTLLAGTLAGNTTLLNSQNYEVSGTLIVPSGVTLTVQPGTVVKFDAAAGLDLQPGSTLIANGTLAQPIYFTSIRDTSIGVATGSSSAAPAPGDWNNVLIDGATASLKFVQMQYGGGPLNNGNQAGMLETAEQANVTIASSIFASSYSIGIQTGYPYGGGDTLTVTDSTFYNNGDRAINVYPGTVMHVVNDTVDSNAAGVFNHGGTLDIENTTITNNSVAGNTAGTQFGGIGLCCGGTFSNLSYNNVFGNPANYAGLTDVTGTLGNLSVAPVYMNGPQHDYRPTYGSPLIDSANGTAPNYPTLDAYNDARINSPLVPTKTGIPDSNGKYPDIGAFEFVQTASSDLDLTVSNVVGPDTALVGNQVTVTWTVTNIGQGTVYGPWHDSVLLISDPKTNPVESLGGTFLEGVGVVLGPGASYSASASVTVPGATVGPHQWEVKTNVRGEIFEGANTTNNSALSVDPVAVDLAELTAGTGPVTGTFSAQGSLVTYKLLQPATQTTAIQLSLTGGATGSVQLFVGGGYVPTPQHFDYQQTEFNSPTASLVLPAGSTQTYYVVAYAQTLTTAPATFSLQASVPQFSLTSVSPNTATTAGPATLVFNGGGFTSNTVFNLVAADGTMYNATATSLTDAVQAYVTFPTTSIPVGTYAATATDGTTITLAGAVTVQAGTTITFSGGGAGNDPSGLSFKLDTPEALRVGFPALVTLSYINLGSSDLASPMISISATGGTLTRVAPPCTGCSANFPQMYQTSSNSGLVLAINNQGPAGVLPVGAGGSVQFEVTSTGSTVNFALEALSTYSGDFLIHASTISEIGAGPNGTTLTTYQSDGLYGTAVALCSAYTPPHVNAAGFTRTCMQLLSREQYNYRTCPVQDLNTFVNAPDCGSLYGGNLIPLLAADATLLSSADIYESDAQNIFGHELQIDGVDTFNKRYHQGLFGYGESLQYDITGQMIGTPGSAVIFYPDGSTRTFPNISSTQPNVSYGAPGDYGTLTSNADGSATLTEQTGTIYHFNPAGTGGISQLGFLQDLNGNQTNFAYTNGLLSSATDAFGASLTFEYDGLGHISKITDPVGRTTTYTYDTLNDTLKSAFLTSVTDVTGTTKITWNEGGPHGVGYIDDSCITTLCEPAISVTSIARPDNTHTFFTYDALGRLTGSSNDGGAQALTYTYGPDGKFTITDALGGITQIATNQYGSTSQITDALNAVTRFSFDSEQKKIAVQGPLGTHIGLGYDAMGNLNSLTDPLGKQQTFAFNSFGSLQSFTDPNGNATSFTYDLHDNPIAVMGPDQRGLQATYDAHGNVASLTNARGDTVQFAYNAKGLLISKTYPTGNPFTYTYDAHNNLQTVSAANGTTTYLYDSADRLSTVTYPNGHTLTYAYNAGGQPILMGDSAGFTVKYSYDPSGRLATVTDASNNILASYTYDATGQLIKKTLGNGTYTTYTYDAVGNLLHLVNSASAGSILSEYDQTYDALGNQTAVKGPLGSTSTYTYDADGQITAANVSGLGVTFTYDDIGNRTAASTFPYQVNNLNEYTSVNNAPYTYDADGNLTSGAGVSYTYDLENRMTSMTTPTDTYTYQYDGLGQRIGSTHNGVATQYLLDPNNSGNIVAQLDGSGQAIAHFSYGLDLVSSVPASGSPAYYHFDAAGNTVQLTNGSGSVVNSYNYLPFGEKASATATIANPFTFVGQFGVLDEGSGLYFMRNRSYSSTLGRFVQRDPTGLAGGTNLYAYTNNNPRNYVDPQGTCPTEGGEQGGKEGESAPSGIFEGNAQAQDAMNVRAALQKDGMFSETNAEHQEAMHVGQDGIKEIGGAAIVGGLPELEAIPAAVEEEIGGVAAHGANVVANHYLIHKPAEYVIGRAQEDCPPPAKSHFVPFLKDFTHWATRGYFFAKDPDVVRSLPADVSRDPNGKITSGFGDNGFVPAGEPITYTIYFENQPAATAPAVRVTVSDTLPANLDLSTLQFNQISFNNVTLTVPQGAQTYSTQASVSTDPNPVQVSTTLNPTTGLLTWTMQSVDPITGALPANPQAGFLPPNNAANAGVGSVTFTVMPKKGLANGTTILNTGSIVFDANAAIVTNTVTNQIDTTLPTSAVAALPATSGTSFLVSWSGSDPTGSGIASFNIYVAMDAGQYTLWQSATASTSATYTGLAGHSYSFVSLATTNVGAQQTTPGTAATTMIVAGVTTPSVSVMAAGSITQAQPLTATITLAGSQGTPTGSVIVTSGSYTSAATVLSNGTAAIVIPANSLALGSDTLTATYTPDSPGSALYGGASGTTMVAVTAVQPSTVQVSVGTMPSGVAFAVDGVSYTGTQTLTWTAGSTHTLTTTSPQIANGTQQTFTAWSDGGALSHSVTAPSTATTYTASFATAYLLTTAASPTAGGSVTPASGTYYIAGTSVALTATPATGYLFTSWTGPVASSSSAATTITLNAPQTVTANFTVNALPVVSLTPAALNFSTVAGSANKQTTQLTNTGAGPLTIGSVAITGTSSSAFTQSNTCGISLATGASCTFTITFTATSVGTFNASLAIMTNASTAASTVSLTGIGTAPATFTLAISPASQSVPPGGTASYVISLTPQGGAFINPITLTASGLPNGATYTFTPATLTPGSSVAQSTLTILGPSVVGALAFPSPRPTDRESNQPYAPIALALLGAGILATRKRRGLLRGLLLALILGCTLPALFGCGSKHLPTTSTVTITATSGSQVQTSTLTFIIQ